MSLTPRLDSIDKNYLINGALDFWQRGSVFSAGPQYVIDRWKSITGTLTYQRDISTPSEIVVPYSLKVTGNGSLSPGIEQRIEQANIRHLIGKTVTFSCYTKVSTGTETVKLKVQNADALDNWSTSTDVYDVTMNASVGTNWVRVNYSFVVTANMAIYGFNVMPYCDTLTSSTDLFMTGFLLNEGSEVQDFRMAGKDIHEELILCQRYLEKSYNINDAPGSTTKAGARAFMAPRTVSAPEFASENLFIVPKRVTPTITIYAVDSGSSGNVRDFSSGADVSASPQNLGENGVHIRFDMIDTRLYMWQYTADAEL